MRLLTLVILGLAVLGFLALFRPRKGAAAQGREPTIVGSAPSKFGTPENQILNPGVVRPSNASVLFGTRGIVL